MAEYKIQESTLVNIADAIRDKTGLTGLIDPTDMADAIETIEAGIDASDATAVAGDILSGKTAYVDGEKITGTIATKTASNLSASGATVTVPSGYYASNATKSVSTTTQATPTISVSNSGLITASATQTAGYVSAGTKTGTKQLTTQSAKTVTPSTSSQTAVASGVYTTGAVTVAGDANLKAENIAEGVSIFGITGTHSGSSGEGYQYAQGYFTPTSNTFTVSGIGFTPKIVYVYMTSIKSTNNDDIYSDDYQIISSMFYDTVGGWKMVSSYYYIKQTAYCSNNTKINAISINDDGFTIDATQAATKMCLQKDTLHYYIVLG